MNQYFLALFCGFSSISKIFCSKSILFFNKVGCPQVWQTVGGLQKGNAHRTYCLAKNLKPHLPSTSAPPTSNLTNTQQTSTKPALMLSGLIASPVEHGTFYTYSAFFSTCLVPNWLRFPNAIGIVCIPFHWFSLSTQIH